MFNISRKAGSNNLYIELFDRILDDKEAMRGIYSKIEAKLIDEYLEKYREEILATVDKSKLQKSLVSALSKNLVERLFKPTVSSL